MEIAVARFALICLVLSGSAPWSIKMEWFALFTLSAVSIVLTVACQVSVFVPVIRDDNGARKIRKTILLMFKGNMQYEYGKTNKFQLIKVS